MVVLPAGVSATDGVGAIQESQCVLGALLALLPPIPTLYDLEGIM